jgi:hypothetical protein
MHIDSKRVKPFFKPLMKSGNAVRRRKRGRPHDLQTHLSRGWKQSRSGCTFKAFVSPVTVNTIRRIVPHAGRPQPSSTAFKRHVTQNGYCSSQPRAAALLLLYCTKRREVTRCNRTHLQAQPCTLPSQRADKKPWPLRMRAPSRQECPQWRWPREQSR